MIIGENRLREIYSSFDDKQFQPNGVDLRLKSVEKIKGSENMIGIIDDKKYLPETEIVTPTNKRYVLKKNTHYIINLGEIHIPKDTIGLFYIRSTLMRMGCILSSSVADMGYNGTLIMGIFNPFQDITLEQNERVVQMVLYEAENDSEYNGDYQENNWTLDEDILIAVDSDGLPITIFGKCVLLDGYLYCGSPRNGLHRFIYEYYKGEIKDNEEIHHRNHNPLDNRIANLEKLTKSEHRSHHNKGIYNLSSKNRKHDLPYGFTVKGQTINGDCYCFQYVDDEGVRRSISDKRFDDLIKKSISILQNLERDYTLEISQIKEWEETHDLDILTFKRLEKNNLPKGCHLHYKKNRPKPSYEFYHPSNNFLGSSVSFGKALEKAIKNTDDELYKSYLIKRWLK